MGVGGERDSTLAMHYKIISKYSITEEEAIEELRLRDKIRRSYT